MRAKLALDVLVTKHPHFGRQELAMTAEETAIQGNGREQSQLGLREGRRRQRRRRGGQPSSRQPHSIPQLDAVLGQTRETPILEEERSRMPRHSDANAKPGDLIHLDVNRTRVSLPWLLSVSSTFTAKMTGETGAALVVKSWQELPSPEQWPKWQRWQPKYARFGKLLSLCHLAVSFYSCMFVF